jgi:hydrogenase maturation factor
VSALPSSSLTRAGEHCITCADDGVPMTVVRTDERRGLALCVDAEGTRHTVETDLVEPLAAGRVVLIHAGVAIAALSSEGGPSAGATSLKRPAEEGATPASAASGRAP